MDLHAQERKLKAVVLSSGGLDSSLLMLLLKQEGYDVHPVHINYGQLAEEKEWSSCQRVAEYLGLPAPVKMDVTGMALLPSGLVNSNLHIEKDAFLPTRNLLFAVMGSAYAFTISSNIVALGILANPIFPDQTKGFIDVTEKCISTAIGRNIKLLTPFITLDKREIIVLAAKHSLPFEITYYCHAGTEKPCGICISCKERIAAENYLKDNPIPNDR
jgi:7-cyano-7-deazaguanine synthase